MLVFDMSLLLAGYFSFYFANECHGFIRGIIVLTT